ncbi:MAG: glycosyltransferase [Armatimonadetes bacterium]|nr:glycosyltransferase [Armatimonadota bacterium]
MRLSVIVLNHSKAAYTRMLLDSLLESTGVEMEFVLVDNGCRDDTPVVLDDFRHRAAAQGHSARVITFETNLGAIVGRNAAMELATGDHFAFLDNDLVVRDRDWAARLLKVLAEEPRIGIVSPKLIFPWEPYDVEFAGCLVTEGGRVIYRGRGEPRELPELNERFDCQCLISACILFPRTLYEAFGGLDEVFSPVQFEDLDFCYRVRELGYRCVLVPEVEMYHWEHTTTAGSTDINFKLVTIRNARTFKLRWRHMIEQEGGPPDETAVWRQIEKHGLEEVGPPPLRR